MKTINRTAILVTPKQPYIDWANSFDDDGPKFDEEATITTAFLIPDSYDEFNYQSWLEENYLGIFKQELDAWMQAPESWPQKVTYQLFREWFEVRVAVELIDLGEEPLFIEEY